MDTVNKSMKELRESVKTMQMHDPMREFRESLKALQMHDPMKEFRESIKTMQMHDPMKEFRESMKAMQMHNPMKEFRESIKAMQIHDPMKEFRESMKAMQMHDPMKELRESIKVIQMHNPMKELQESLNAYQSQNSLGEILKNISNDRWNLVLDSESDIDFNPDGLISVDSTLVTQEQVQEIAHQIFSKVFDGSIYVFEKQIDRLVNEIHSLKDPVLQKILSWLIYPLVVGLVLSAVAPISDFYIKQTLNSGEKKQVIKDISKAITITINDKSLLKSFKIVAVTSLNVRKSGSIKSDIVGNLYLGDIAEVLEKGRKWSLISWQDSETNASVRGWVFSRYLRVIK